MAPIENPPFKKRSIEIVGPPIVQWSLTLVKSSKKSPCDPDGNNPLGYHPLDKYQ